MGTSRSLDGFFESIYDGSYNPADGDAKLLADAIGMYRMLYECLHCSEPDQAAIPTTLEEIEKASEEMRVEVFWLDEARKMVFKPREQDLDSYRFYYREIYGREPEQVPRSVLEYEILAGWNMSLRRKPICYWENLSATTKGLFPSVIEEDIIPY